MDEDYIITQHLARDVYHFKMVLEPLLAYALAEHESRGTGEYKLSPPLLKKFEKQFLVFKKKNEIPFDIEGAPVLVVSEVDAKTQTPNIIDMQMSDAALNVVLRDTTHSVIRFNVGDASIDVHRGDGQSWLLNTRIPHLVVHSQKGQVVELVIRLSHGYNMVGEFV